MTTQSLLDFANAAAHHVGYQIDTAWQRAGAQVVLERLNTPCGRGYLLGLFDYLLTVSPIPVGEQESVLALLYGSFVRDPETAIDIFTQRAGDRASAEVQAFADGVTRDAREAATKGERSHLLGAFLESHKPHDVPLPRRG
jgi:hypothetical protein